MRQVTLAQAQYTAHTLAKELYDFDEPIPEFTTRYPGKLESCLQQPFQVFDGKYLHFRLTRRAALLFYLIIKNHPFVNGNKRMAITITLLFLFINKKWLTVSPDGLYKIACNVAESSANDRNRVLEELNEFFKKYITNQ